MTGTSKSSSSSSKTTDNEAGAAKVTTATAEAPANEAAQAQTAGPEAAEQKDERKAPKASERAAEFGNVLTYAGPHGPALGFVTTPGVGSAEVLVLADGEVPRIRAVGLYDNAQDAAEATAVGAVDRREHAAYWPAG